MTPHEQKTDKILDAVTDIKVEMARILIHQENHAKDISDLMDYKERDKAMKNKAIGGLAVFNLLLAGIGSWASKHL